MASLGPNELIYMVGDDYVLLLWSSLASCFTLKVPSTPISICLPLPNAKQPGMMSFPECYTVSQSLLMLVALSVGCLQWCYHLGLIGLNINGIYIELQCILDNLQCILGLPDKWEDLPISQRPLTNPGTVEIVICCNVVQGGCGTVYSSWVDELARRQAPHEWIPSQRSWLYGSISQNVYELIIQILWILLL